MADVHDARARTRRGRCRLRVTADAVYVVVRADPHPLNVLFWVMGGVTWLGIWLFLVNLMRLDAAGLWRDLSPPRWDQNILLGTPALMVMVATWTYCGLEGLWNIAVGWRGKQILKFTASGVRSVQQLRRRKLGGQVCLGSRAVLGAAPGTGPLAARRRTSSLHLQHGAERRRLVSGLRAGDSERIVAVVLERFPAWGARMQAGQI